MTHDPELMRQWLDHWHHLYDDPDLRSFRDPDDLAGVLADFRRDPDRLARAFAPLPAGPELLRRVRYCIDSESDSRGPYLVPDSRPASDTELTELAREALQRASQVCGNEPPNFRIVIHRREMTAQESQASAPLVEDLGGLYIELAYAGSGPEPTAMQFLNETLYTLAASFAVRGWCTTPLCPPHVQAADPWLPQLELWRRGALAVERWQGEDSWIAVFVPE